MMWFVETIQLHPMCAAAPPYRVDKFLYHYSDCANSDPSIPFLAFDSETSQNLMPEHDFPSGSWENSGLRSCPCVLTYMRIIGPLNRIPLSCHMISPLCIVIT